MRLRDKEAARLAELRAEGLPLHVLHGEVVEIAGVRIVGATLWTDFRLFPGANARRGSRRRRS